MNNSSESHCEFGERPVELSVASDTIQKRGHFHFRILTLRNSVIIVVFHRVEKEGFTVLS